MDSISVEVRHSGGNVKWPEVTFVINAFNQDGLRLEPTKFTYHETDSSSTNTYASNAMRQLSRRYPLNEEQAKNVEARLYSKLRPFERIEQNIKGAA